MIVNTITFSLGQFKVFVKFAFAIVNIRITDT